MERNKKGVRKEGNDGKATEAKTWQWKATWGILETEGKSINLFFFPRRHAKPRRDGRESIKGKGARWTDSKPCLTPNKETTKPSRYPIQPHTTSLHYPNFSSCYHIHPKHNTCTHLLNTKRNKVCPPHQKQTPRDSVQANQLIKFQPRECRN